MCALTQHSHHTRILSFFSNISICAIFLCIVRSPALNGGPVDQLGFSVLHVRAAPSECMERNRQRDSAHRVPEAVCPLLVHACTQLILGRHFLHLHTRDSHWSRTTPPLTHAGYAQVRARMDRQIEAPDPEKFSWEKSGCLVVQVHVEP